jgi:hypothetical protein
MTTMPAPVDVSVDFSRVGCAIQFTSMVRASVRALLHEGDEVTVSDDDVEPRLARVVRVSMSDPAVEFRLLADWSSPAAC